MKNREELLLEIIHLMADKFKDRIVLEGGMLLRLLNSNRSTQDIDYVLLSKKSKKILVNDIKKILKELSNLKIEDVKLNSRGIFITVEDREARNLKAVLEISVLSSLHMPSEHLSTVNLSNKYSISGRIVTTMALPEALSNKIAATLERDTLRDLYDISILEGLCRFDEQTLLDRLAKLSIGRKKPNAVSIEEAADMLEEKANKLTKTKVEKELAPLLPKDRWQGIQMIIKASVVRVVNAMRVLSD